jgi:Zn-dependent protease
LGRVGGVTVGVNWSLFALAALVAYFLATSRLPIDVPGYTQSAYWLAGSLTAIALLAAVLLHELAHAIVARRAKLHVDGITLWFMGGVTRVEGDSRKPSVEFAVGVVGPLASAVIGALAGGLSLLAGDAGWGLAAGSLRWLGLMNVLLALFNLLPASPLDGGRVIHGLLWWVTKKRWLATRLTAAAGVGLGAVCAMAGVLTLGSKDGGLDGVVLLLMAWFLVSSAKREQLVGRAQHVLGDVKVSDIMRTAVIAPGWLTVNAFWASWVTRYPEAAFVLERWGGEGTGGVVTAQQLAAVPPSLQWSVRAQDVAVTLPSDTADPLSPDQPALAVAGHGNAALPVRDHGVIVGVVLALDLVAMVSRGTPVQPRTWTGLWPAPVPSQTS